MGTDPNKKKRKKVKETLGSKAQEQQGGITRRTLLTGTASAVALKTLLQGVGGAAGGGAPTGAVAMTGAALCAAGIGFLGVRSYALAAALVLVYGLVIWLDSSSLTAGGAVDCQFDVAGEAFLAQPTGAWRGKAAFHHRMGAADGRMAGKGQF